MDPLTAIALIAAIMAMGTAWVLEIKLRETREELDRAKRRMARLDELAEGVATLEFKAVPDEAPQAVELPADTSDEMLAPKERHDTPLPQSVPQRELTALDSGTFPVVGLEMNTEDVFDEEDPEEFAAPRMTREVVEDRRVQKPNRKRHETPVGSPRNLTPRTGLSVVEVGKIQVRSDHGE